jgi:hypothetical protein
LSENVDKYNVYDQQLSIDHLIDAGKQAANISGGPLPLGRHK